jgi:hypothetical protein
MEQSYESNQYLVKEELKIINIRNTFTSFYIILTRVAIVICN